MTRRTQQRILVTVLTAILLSFSTAGLAAGKFKSKIPVSKLPPVTTPVVQYDYYPVQIFGNWSGFRNFWLRCGGGRCGFSYGPSAYLNPPNVGPSRSPWRYRPEL